MKYYQCELQRHDTVRIAWLPAKYARAGHYLRIADEDGWHVNTVWLRVALTAEQLLRQDEARHGGWDSIDDASPHAWG